jgi:hypothetical protein
MVFSYGHHSYANRSSLDVMNAGARLAREKSRISPADQLALLVVFGPVDFAAGKTPIESGKSRVLSCARSPINNPDDNGGQHDEDDQQDDHGHINPPTVFPDALQSSHGLAEAIFWEDFSR